MSETKHAVMVRTTVGSWTTHSTYDRRADAQDQADMVGGRVVTVPESYLDENGRMDEETLDGLPTDAEDA